MSHIPLQHADLDIADAAAARRFLDASRPEVVVNCAAFCSFQGCEENPQLSQSVNLDAPCRWADACASRGIRMLHFSSDYIFDGMADTPYLETSKANPQSVYARHKLGCERHFATHPEHLILRISWLFGAGGRTFLSLMPNLLLERDQLTVASGKRGACLHAGYAASVILQLVEARAAGLINLVHDGEMSWEEFAAECLAELRGRALDPACQAIDEVPYRKLLRAGDALRPAYSVLDTGRLRDTLNMPVKPWRDGLRDYLDALFPANVATSRGGC